MKKKILILNFTRIGDLIQTTPLMTALKEKDPDCEITLLGNVKFAGICEHMSCIDRLRIFDVQQFHGASGGGTSILDIYRYLDRLVDELKDERFDILINLSHSKLTAVLGRLLEISDVRGFYSTEDGQRLINDPWLVYFSAFISFRKYNSFNLVDLYQLGGGTLPAGRRLSINHADVMEKARPVLERFGIKDGDRVIGIQAGASMKERRWPSKKFASSADIISAERDAKVLLFGTAAEKELVDEVEAAMKRPAVNLAGKTSLEELVAMVERCELLVTNDTATMHIAAAVGTPSIALFLVHAYPPETAPYAEGSIIIEPDIPCFPCGHNTLCPHYACLDKVSPEAVGYAAGLLSRRGRDDLMSGERTRMEGAKMNVTFFDELGFLDLKPLERRTPEEHEIIARMYRFMFAAGVRKGIGDEYWLGYLRNNFIPWEKDIRDDWAARKISNFRSLSLLAEEAMAVTRSMERDYGKGKTANMKRKATALEELDEKIATLAFAHEEVMPIVRLFQMGKENMRGTDIRIMLAQTRVLYQVVMDSCSFMASMLKRFSSTEEWGRVPEKFVDIGGR